MHLKKKLGLSLLVTVCAWSGAALAPRPASAAPAEGAAVTPEECQYFNLYQCRSACNRNLQDCLASGIPASQCEQEHTLCYDDCLYYAALCGRG